MNNDTRLQRHVTFCTGADYENQGSRAELATVHHLVEHLDTNIVGDYRILVNYNIPRQGADLREIDLLVINAFHVFLIEVKDWRGRIDVYDNGWYLDGVFQGNILHTLSRKVKILRGTFFGPTGRLASPTQQVNVSGAIVLARGLSRFNNHSNSDTRAIFELTTQRLVNALSSTQLHIILGPAYRNLGKQEIQRFRDGIYKEHVSGEKRAGKYILLDDGYLGNPFVSYEASDPVTDRRVRVKKYEMPTVQPERMALLENHFLRSAKAVWPLSSHAHILHSYDYFPSPTEGPHVSYEVTELIDGQRLDEIMAGTSKKLPLEEQLKYLIPVADALQAAHGYQPSPGVKSPIYHRNVCPEVIFVARDGAIKLGDFDFAKLTGKKTIFVQGGAKMEWSVYNSPEMRTAPSGVKAPADIYSLGMLWFHLASLPKQTPTIDASKPQSAIATLPLPEESKALLTRMLAFAPDRRPQTMAEVVQALQQLLDNA